MSGAHIIPLDEVLSTTRTLVGRDAVYPDNRYPLVRRWPTSLNTVHFEKPANVIVMFVEGLDRRFLGRRYGDIAGTPFLDRLKNDSVYFENFFANGVQTSRGLFSTLCSYYPRHGAAAMKTRYAHDYLCLPSVLQRQGYKTEMVIGQHRDLNRLQMFMARNGLQELFSESEFPPDAERIGLGMSDGALFELVGERVGILQAAERPFFSQPSRWRPIIRLPRRPIIRTYERCRNCLINTSGPSDTPICSWNTFSHHFNSVGYCEIRWSLSSAITDGMKQWGVPNLRRRPVILHRRSSFGWTSHCVAIRTTSPEPFLPSRARWTWFPRFLLSTEWFSRSRPFSAGI